MQHPFSTIIVVSREEVETQDTFSVLEALSALIQSPAQARSFFEQVEIAFDGYNETREELFEIAEVRNFVQQLDEVFPFWLYFLSKTGTSLQCITYCFLPPFLTKAAKAKIFPERLDDLLTKRWFPAMNQVCEWTGFSEQEIESLTERSAEYLIRGPLGA